MRVLLLSYIRTPTCVVFIGWLKLTLPDRYALLSVIFVALGPSHDAADTGADPPKSGLITPQYGLLRALYLHVARTTYCFPLKF